MLRFRNNLPVEMAATNSSIIMPPSYVSFKIKDLRSFCVNFTVLLKHNEGHPIVSLQVSRESFDLDKPAEGNFKLDLNNITGEITAEKGIQYSFLYHNSRKPDMHTIICGNVHGSSVEQYMRRIQEKCMEVFTLFPDVNESIPEKGEFCDALLGNIKSSFSTVLMSFGKNDSDSETAHDLVKLLEAIDLSMENALIKYQSKPASNKM